MDIKRENLPKSRVKLTIQVPQEKMQGFFKEAYKKLAPSVDIKGFRSGSAPRAMTLESLGHGRYQQEALNIALSQTFFDAIQKEKLVSLNQPAVSVKDFSEGKDFIYEAEFDILPKIELGDYKKIKVKKEHKEHKVEPHEIDKVLKSLQFQSAKFTEVSRSAQNGDRLEVEFQGSIDNVPQENLSSKNHPLILGEGTLLPDFEKALIGMSKGEEKEFDLEVPATQNPKDKKKAHFKTKVAEVKEVILGKLDDDFAKIFGHKTLAELRQAISGSVLKEKELGDRRSLEAEVLDKLVLASKIDLPESLVEEEISRRLVDLQKQMGGSMDKFLEKSKKTLADLRIEIKPTAEKNVKIGLLLGEVARKENVVLPKEGLKDAHGQHEFTKKIIDRIIDLATN